MSIYIGGSGYTRPKMSDGDIKSEIRNIKLKIISGEYSLNFSDVNLKKHNEELNFILNRLSENDIITGSLALKVYGLLDREIGDLDIIIDDPHRYQGYRNSGYGQFRLDNRLGYKKFIEKGWWPFTKKEYQVDFFKNDNVKFIEMNFNGKKLKIHNPIDIIKHKSDMFVSMNKSHGFYRGTETHKHYKDLIHIFKVINLEY